VVAIPRQMQRVLRRLTLERSSVVWPFVTHVALPARQALHIAGAVPLDRLGKVCEREGA
jgi:hypothetical protein